MSGRSPADVAAILERRARELAKPGGPSPTRPELVDLLILSVDHARYAVDVSEVASVIATRTITRLPSVPSFVAGVMPYRGGVIPVLDLARVSSRPGTSPPSGGYVAVLGRADELVGLRAEAVEVVAVRADDINREPGAGAWSSYVRGVTGDGILVLAGAGLAQAPELTVQEEVSTIPQREGA